jgi:arabinose-5-phosphate isomerase
MMANCPGRVIVCGIGKSGHVGRKIAASLASLGQPAFFLHAAEAIHGDLGMVTADDVMILISHSGETKEVLNLLPSLRRIGPKRIALTGKSASTLARNCDITLCTHVEREADAMNLAPTTSAVVTLGLGDALAVVVSMMRGFTRENFAVFHPGGALGKQLLGDAAM